MKNQVRRLLLTEVFLLSLSAFGAAQVEDTYRVDWNYEAPEAPEGSRTGTVVIKGDAITMSFDDFTRFSAEWVRAPKDSIIYEVAFDDTTVRFLLKVRDANNIVGKAVWNDGETPVYLRRKVVGIIL